MRLLRGDMARATVFSDDPAGQAAAFAAAGAEWLHVVDLDGAFAGHPVNGDAVAAILAAVDVPVQLGGGIRDAVTVARGAPIGRQHHLVARASTNEAEAALALAQPAEARAEVALEAAVVEPVPVAPGHAREAFDFGHNPHMGRCATKRKS